MCTHTVFFLILSDPIIVYVSFFSASEINRMEKIDLEQSSCRDRKRLLYLGAHFL